jgi:phosphate uptake regulator
MSSLHYLSNTMSTYRKIIKFGKNSLIITLPKEWTERNGIEPGDSVKLDILSKDLLIAPRYEEGGKPPAKQVLISADIDDYQTIKRRIISSYIENADTITIKGKLIPTHAKNIRETMHGILALEIMEESPDRIIANCFLNMNDISLSSILRKVDNIIRSMFIDIISQVREPHKYAHLNIITNIGERDRDVNRLIILVLRCIKHYLENPRSRRAGMESSILVEQWDWARILEKIGDELKRASRLIPHLNNEQAQALIILIELIYKYYQDIMQALFKRDLEALYKLETKKKHHIELLEDYRERFETTIAVSKALQKTISLYHQVQSLSIVAN